MPPIDELVLVIGAMKAGTSSVHYYLDLHPDVRMSRTKELDFFTGESNWKRGLDWYLRKLPSGPGLKGESSPSYTKCTLFSGVPERIRDTVARPKLIYVLRDPIERMVAQWVHNYSDGREERPLETALGAVEMNGYFEASCYALQLETYLKVFPQETIRVVALESLRRQPTAAMSDLFAFLGVDAAFSHAGFTEVRHASAQKKALTPLGRRIRHMPGGRFIRKNLGWMFEAPLERPQLSDEARSRLAERLAPDTERLRALTGQSFSDWTV